MFREDEETKRALSALESAIRGRRRPLAVWLGAGVSKWAGYPLWQDLAETMHGRFSREAGTYAKDDATALLVEKAYPRLFQEMRASDPTFYFACLRDAFPRRRPDAVYERMLRALERMAPECILTTNVDESLEHHLAGAETVQRSDVERMPQLLRERRAFIAKLHGSISSVGTTVFSEQDYSDVRNDASFLNALRSIFAECNVLFLGYGLRDEHVVSALQGSSATHPLFGTGPHFIVTSASQPPPPPDVRRISYIADPSDHRSALHSAR